MAYILDYEERVHIEPSQISKRSKAEALKASQVKVNKEDQTAKILGSALEPYHVSLSDCTCPDYAVYGLPCKHMYRLAIDLGIFPRLPKVDRNEEKLLIKKELEMWETEFLSGHVSADKYVKIVKALKSK